MRRLLFPVLLLASPAFAQHTSVLFIGNSYTYVNDLPNTFRALALSLGDTVDVEMVATGGYTLAQHFESDTTLAAIAERPWDFVVLQEQSQVPALPPSLALTECYGSARLLVERIKQNHECTFPVFYMTWGHEYGDELNCPAWPPVCTFDGMQELLRERYLELATANNGCVAPVGVAWKQVRDTYPLIDLYQTDGSHPTVEGTYLGACVFYATLFHSSCVGASFISSLPPTTAAVFQAVASTTVLDSTATWGIDRSHGMSAQIAWMDNTPSGIYTFHHPGQGQHWWECSDGQTSTEADPSFQLQPGDYTITHIYTDLCGITDSVTWAFQVWNEGTIGIQEAARNAGYQVVATAPGMLDVICGTGAEQFSLVDLQGRMLLSRSLDVGRTRIACPAGAYLWWLRTNSGRMLTGKVFVE